MNFINQNAWPVIQTKIRLKIGSDWIGLGFLNWFVFRKPIIPSNPNQLSFWLVWITSHAVGLDLILVWWNLYLVWIGLVEVMLIQSTQITQKQWSVCDSVSSSLNIWLFVSNWKCSWFWFLNQKFKYWTELDKEFFQNWLDYVFWFGLHTNIVDLWTDILW